MLRNLAKNMCWGGHLCPPYINGLGSIICWYFVSIARMDTEKPRVSGWVLLPAHEEATLATWMCIPLRTWPGSNFPTAISQMKCQMKPSFKLVIDNFPCWDAHPSSLIPSLRLLSGKLAPPLAACAATHSQANEPCIFSCPHDVVWFIGFAWLGTILPVVPAQGRAKLPQGCTIKPF